MCLSRVLPPVEYCRVVSPSQAANWRPELKSLASPTVATTALAVIGSIRRARAKLTPPYLYETLRLVHLSRLGHDVP